MERWFTKGFRERSPEQIKMMSDMFVATPLEGYIGCGEAVRDMDHRALLPKIGRPTLVIIGRHDPATTPEAGEYVRNNIPAATSAILDAAHISNIEQPEQYTKTILKFLSERTT
jgi:3-oxoadipate enol-lactonase